MKKYFRKIVVGDKEYDWRYQSCYYSSYIQIYEVYYEYNSKKNLDIRKRRFLKQIEVSSSVSITPIQVEELIRCGHLLNKNSIRRRKLLKLKSL